MTVPSLKSSNSGLAPIPAAKRVHDALIAMANGLEGHGIAGEVLAYRSAPSDEQRRWMVARVAELDGALAPAGDRERRAEIASLFAVLAVEGSSEQEATAIAGIYLADTADLPLFALRAACQAFRRSGKWVPKIAELRERALREANPWRGERAKIARILDARVIEPSRDESAKARNLAHAEETKRLIALTTAKSEAAFRQNKRPDQIIMPEDVGKSPAKLAEEWLEREKANPHCPDPSPALRAILGLPEMQANDERAA